MKEGGVWNVSVAQKEGVENARGGTYLLRKKKRACRERCADTVLNNSKKILENRFSNSKRGSASGIEKKRGGARRSGGAHPGLTT